MPTRASAAYRSPRRAEAGGVGDGCRTGVASQPVHIREALAEQVEGVEGVQQHHDRVVRAHLHRLHLADRTYRVDPVVIERRAPLAVEVGPAGEPGRHQPTGTGRGARTVRIVEGTVEGSVERAVDGHTYALLARIPAEGPAAFAAYEDAVLPLLAQHGARLDLRLRTAGGRVELHLLWFAGPEALEAYRRDPRRAAHAHLLEASRARTDLFPLPDGR